MGDGPSLAACVVSRGAAGGGPDGAFLFLQAESVPKRSTEQESTESPRRWSPDAVDGGWLAFANIMVG